MTAERTARDLSTRTSTQRKRSWQAPSLLPDPAPDGQYRYKWIRVASLGESDPRNTSSKLREGWELVPPDDPAVDGIRLATDAKSTYTGTVEIGGLALARMPIEMAQQREAHYQEVARSQTEAVDRNFLRENDPRMPLLVPEKVSKISS